MKLLIDIPEEDYKFIKSLHSMIIGGRGNCKSIQKNVINAIRNGTLLDKSIDNFTTENPLENPFADYIREVYSKIMDLEFENSDEFWIMTPKGKKIYFEKKRLQGEWIKVEEGYSYHYECDICHERPLKSRWGHEDEFSNFCPNCGADMRGGKE